MPTSVKELVLEQNREERERREEYEENQEKERKKQASKQFSGEVAYLIKHFEFNCFKLDSTNKKVADFIRSYSERNYFITREGNLKQTMPGFIKVDPYMYAIKFEKNESPGVQHITRSSKYNKWKKALEDKFGIKIWINRKYTYTERYGNSGYRTYDDKHFQGVSVQVRVKD